MLYVTKTKKKYFHDVNSSYLLLFLVDGLNILLVQLAISFVIWEALRRIM